MKIILIAIALLLITTNAYCGLITYDTTATLTRDYLNDTFNRVYNVVNGGLDTNNLSTGAVASKDIATAANPLVRDFNNIGEYVYSGLTIPTSTDLSSTTTAGIAYVANDGDSTLHRVVTAATGKTYTASKDTYVYLDYTGAFTYTEVANGGTQPTTPLNSIIIAKVVTDNDNITSVTDLRTTSPANLRIYSDYIVGCPVSRDIGTATKISIDIGEIEFGSANGKVRTNTTPVYVNLATSGRGGLDTGSLAAGYYYIFAVADDDNSANWEGIASLSNSDATGVTGERLIGWCYANSATNISADSVGAYKNFSTSPNVAHRYDDTSKTISTALLGVTPPLNIVTSGRPVVVSVSATGLPAGDTALEFSVSIDTATVERSRAVIEYEHTAYDATGTYSFVMPLDEGSHTFQLYGVRAGGAGSDVTIKRVSMSVIEQ